jgi:hypothetical protein
MSLSKPCNRKKKSAPGFQEKWELADFCCVTGFCCAVRLSVFQRNTVQNAIMKPVAVDVISTLTNAHIQRGAVKAANAQPLPENSKFL